MGDFPSHASPALGPLAFPVPHHRQHSLSKLDRETDFSGPPPLVSPAFTPPRTPSSTADGQRHDREHDGITTLSSLPPPAAAGNNSILTAHDDDSDSEPKPRLLAELPKVTCQVRARIPTTAGTEMWLHLYHNSADSKEHLAIVFGPHIRSRSLDAPREGETERDRMIRGAYVGTLYPGRTTSRLDSIRREAGVSSASPRASAEFLSSLNGPSSSSQLSGSPPSTHNSCAYFEAKYPAHLGPPLVRIHSECYTGETVWSARCDCGEQLDEAARLMSMPIPSAVGTPDSDTSGALPLDQKLPPCGGVIIYLRQEGRGIGLLSKLKAYNLQDLGHDTMEANILLRHPGDARSYGLATAMLMDLGLGGDQGIKLLTNNPEKIRAVEGPNREVRVIQRVPMIPLAWKSGGKEGVHGPEVERYISTKIEKFKHMFTE